MVVSKISISWRLSFDPPLDGLVLPRGWLASNKDFSAKKDVRIGLVVDVLDHVRDLLMRLQSDTASRKQLQASMLISKPNFKNQRDIHAVTYQTNTNALQFVYLQNVGLPLVL